MFLLCLSRVIVRVAVKRSVWLFVERFFGYCFLILDVVKYALERDWESFC